MEEEFVRSFFEKEVRDPIKAKLRKQEFESLDDLESEVKSLRKGLDQKLQGKPVSSILALQ